MKRLLVESLRAALAELEPAGLVRPHLTVEPPALILAVGKAALTMLAAARVAFPAVPWIATPPLGPGVGTEPSSNYRGSNHDGRGLLGLLPGAHPLPDERSVNAAEAVLHRVRTLGPNDTLLLLVSGGGSSLWCAPDGVTLKQKRQVIDHLLRAGADIFELNAVRKHLSRIKGGRLAAQVKGRILSLVISDVPGDDLSFVASGVAAPSIDTFADALAVLDKYGIDAPAARAHLERGVRGEIPENPRPDDPLWQRVESRLIGSNRHLLEAAQRYWQQQGYRAVILSDRFQGEARDVARAHADAVRHLRAGGSLSGLEKVMQLGPLGMNSDTATNTPTNTPTSTPLVLLSGGETTVTVKGSGQGGRNQEFALWLLHYLGPGGVWAISAGSDGVDGNSEAAGAVLRPDSWDRARGKGLDPQEFLERNDSYSFFRALGDSVITGPTGNNLNDYRAVVVE